MRRLCLLLVVALSQTCSRPAEVSQPPAGKHLTFSILEDYDKDQDLDEVERDFALFDELGVTTWRGSFGWDDYEPRRGVYDFAWLHRFASRAASRGITLRPYIGYTPAWSAAGGTDSDAWNDPPKDLEAWATFVRTLAADMRRHRNVVSYEIYNEENVKQWWDGTAEAYREVFRRGAAAIAEGNPDAQVLLGGMVFPDNEWIETVCSGTERPPRLDVIPFHAYPETWTPENVTVETYLGARFESDFVAAADAACGRKPIWINELGYATTPGRTEANQASWWVRAIATFAAEPRVEHLGIYEIKDAPRDRPVIGETPNYYLGLVDVNRRKKLAFGTVKRLVAMLGQQPIAPSRPRVTTSGAPASDDVHRHLFTRSDGTRFLFLWTQRSKATVDTEIGGSDRTVTEYRIDGNPAGPVDVDDGWLRGIALQPGVVRYFEIPH